MNVHIDEELRMHAAQTLQSLMSECADWREDIIHSFINYMTAQFSVKHLLFFNLIFEDWLEIWKFNFFYLGGFYSHHFSFNFCKKVILILYSMKHTQFHYFTLWFNTISKMKLWPWDKFDFVLNFELKAF